MAIGSGPLGQQVSGWVGMRGGGTLVQPAGMWVGGHEGGGTLGQPAGMWVGGHEGGTLVQPASMCVCVGGSTLAQPAGMVTPVAHGRAVG